MMRTELATLRDALALTDFQIVDIFSPLPQKMTFAIGHQRSILKIQKPVEVLI
jgi:hypothetical protein